LGAERGRLLSRRPARGRAGTPGPGPVAGDRPCSRRPIFFLTARP
jgi:hypothetical protein